MPCETVGRRLLAACLVGFACATAISLGPSVSWAQTNAESTVQTAMTKGEGGMYGAYDGHFVKWLPRFGDASAVALTKILAAKPITDTDIPAILIIVRDSYDFLICIEDAADRKPRTTLFVLSSLSARRPTPKSSKRSRTPEHM